MQNIIKPVRHGLILGIVALIFGALWAAYLATNHEKIHGGFEAQQEKLQQFMHEKMAKNMSMDSMTMGEATPHSHDTNQPRQPAGHAHGDSDDKAGGHEAGGQHSHTGSLANDAMQRLMRGHIHAMGLGVLVCVLLLITALTSLKDGWKKLLGLTFGLGTVLYPPAWIIMGFRTVELGPEAAEASIMWLFGPAVALLLVSMLVLLKVLVIEQFGLENHRLFSWLFV